MSDELYALDSDQTISVAHVSVGQGEFVSSCVEHGSCTIPIKLLIIVDTDGIELTYRFTERGWDIVKELIQTT